MDTKNLMNIEEVVIQLGKIKMYIEEENKCLQNIKSYNNEILQVFNSTKNDKINNINQITNDMIDKIIEKRKAYIEIIQKSINNYEIAADKTNSIFNNISRSKNNG